MFHRARLLAAVLALTSTLTLAQSNGTAEPGPDSAAAKPLAGTHWTLTQLNGQAIHTESGREIYIELTPNGNRVSGSGGCNRLIGSYELDGASLHFKQVASTMMACLGDTMTQEQSFVKALSATTSFRIHGATLLLRGEDDTVLARLDAQAPPTAEGFCENNSGCPSSPKSKPSPPE